GHDLLDLWRHCGHQLHEDLGRRAQCEGGAIAIQRSDNRRGTALSASRAPVRLLLAVAFAVVAVDLASKAFALILLADSYVEVGGPFFLSLIFNDAPFAGSTTLNGMALPLSFLGSLILVALALPACAPLSEHDSRAPVALGLMVGAAVANPASLALQPAGVTDFLGISSGGQRIIFNLADVAVSAVYVQRG